MKKVETGKMMKAAAAIKRLGRALSIFLLLPIAGSLLPSAVCAEVPVKFTYQGNLRQAGFLVNGQRSMVFRIYSSSTSAIELWTSPVYNINLSTGVFRATLEPVLSDWESGNLWLELEVEGIRMSPREELTSSPYSINSLMVSGKRYITAPLPPAPPLALGDLWYDSTLNVINFWNGTTWTSAGGSGAGSPHAPTHAGAGSDPITSLGAHTVTGPLLLQGTLNATSNLSVGGSGYTVTFASSVTAGWFRGNGSGLTNLNASRLTSGYVSGDRIANVIVSTHIVDGAILTQDLADGAVTKEKLNQSGCANGDILKLTGGLWVCSSGSGNGAETDPLSIHNQETLQAGTTFYVSSGTVNDLTANTIKVMDVILRGTLNPSSDLLVGGAGYAVTFASSVTAGFFHGDGSMLTGIDGKDDLGNHIATTTLNMAGFEITAAGSVTGSSFTATGAGLAAALLRLGDNVYISSETSADLGGGVNISSNVYIVGFSSAAKYFGDGSLLTGIVAGKDDLGNHVATMTLNMAGFDITGAGSVTGSSFTATGTGLGAAQLRLADNVFISSEASADLGGGVNISSNVYIVGFSSAARYFGDGSGLTGLASVSDNLGNHIATTTLNMSGFDIVGVSTLTVSSITTTAAEVTFSTNVFINGNLGVGAENPAARLAVTGTENSGQYIAVFNSGSKLAAWLRNK